MYVNVNAYLKDISYESRSWVYKLRMKTREHFLRLERASCFCQIRRRNLQTMLWTLSTSSVLNWSDLSAAVLDCVSASWRESAVLCNARQGKRNLRPSKKRDQALDVMNRNL